MSIECGLVELRQAGPYRLGHVGLIRNLREEIGIIGHCQRVERDGLELLRQGHGHRTR